MNWPSVTQALSPFADFSHVPADRLEYAAARGTKVHEICARVALGEYVIDLDPETSGYTSSFMAWWGRCVAEAILVEERLVDEALGFHGQLDLVVRLKHGENALVDLKTPVTNQRSWKLQIAAYRHLCELAGHKIDKAGTLQLSPDGKTARMRWAEDSAKDFNVFLSALNCYRYFNS